jgi:hypothetical protein
MKRIVIGCLICGCLAMATSLSYHDFKDGKPNLKTIENDMITIKTNKTNDILYDGEEFLFQVLSKEDGFVSILNVYEDGTISTLLKNNPIKRNILTFFPDEKGEHILVSGILEIGKETSDMYVVVWSDKKLPLEKFADATDEVIEDEKYIPRTYRKKNDIAL